jgi:hypothetical protein
VVIIVVEVEVEVEVGIQGGRGLAAVMIMIRIVISKVVDMIMALVNDRDNMVGVVLQGRVRLGDDSYLVELVVRFVSLGYLDIVYPSDITFNHHVSVQLDDDFSNSGSNYVSGMLISLMLIFYSISISVLHISTE